MWDICDRGSEQEANSDGYGSDLETFLYSSIYHDAEEETPVPEASPTAAFSSNDANAPVLMVVKPRKRCAGASTTSADEMKCVVKKVKRSKVPALAALVAQPEPSASATADCILLSSDDDNEVVVFSEDSQESIALNVVETSQDKENKSGLWHVDAEDLYRDSRGFRYHHRLANVHCRNCDQMGHLSKHCSQPKVTVCPFCSELGHNAKHCPQRMCSRCYMRGHVLSECKQTFVPTCSRCNTKGHPDERCPDLWRRYHMTTVDGPIVRAHVKVRPREERFCFNCGRQGHYGHQCHQRKQGNPTTPYIISYKDPFRPEQPPLVLRDEKRKQRADKKRKWKSEQLKKRQQVVECSGQATPCHKQALRGGKMQAALHNGQTSGTVHNGETTQSERPPSEPHGHAAENCEGQQATQDGGAPAAKRQKKSPVKAVAPKSKRAVKRQKLREKRRKEREKQKRQQMKNPYQGEESSYARCSNFDNPSFYMPNNWRNKTFWGYY